MAGARCRAISRDRRYSQAIATVVVVDVDNTVEDEAVHAIGEHGSNSCTQSGTVRQTYREIISHIS